MANSDSQDNRATVAAWLTLIVGLAAVYTPTFFDLSRTLWRTDQNAHGPIILAVALWLLVHKSRGLVHVQNLKVAPNRLAGGCVLVAGLLLYALGRSQTVYLFEVGSLIPVLAGCILILFGRHVLARLWFVFIFMLFMVPLPGSVVDTITQPLKIGVSWCTEHILYAAGYPIAREGVILTIGQYKLLVADACSGLNSMFTLESVGLLYLNITRHESAVRNFIIALLILPISFASNLVRVIILSLITFHYGDDAGSGFMHMFSGLLLFLVALLLVIAVDSILRSGIVLCRRFSGLPAT